MDNSLELPNEIVINGATYRRLNTQDDPAYHLLNRIISVKAALGCSYDVAAWAVRCTSYNGSEFPEPPAELGSHFVN